MISQIYCADIAFSNGLSDMGKHIKHKIKKARHVLYREKSVIFIMEHIKSFLFLIAQQNLGSRDDECSARLINKHVVNGYPDI